MKNNTCDKCGTEVVSEDLIWITTDDFKPLASERLISEKIKDIDAICEPCYETVIDID